MAAEVAVRGAGAGQRTAVLMFPGQTARDPQMLERALQAWPEGIALVEQASGCIARDARACLLGERPFSCNRDIQMAVFLTSHIHCAALERKGLRTSHSIGLSLGEYNHLVHVGALDFVDAVKLIDERGRCYDRGPRGKMVAVLALEEQELLGYLRQCTDKGALVISNYNSPTQHVIAGEVQAVNTLVELLEGETTATCVTVDDRIAMHTSLMDAVAAEFLVALSRVRWRQPSATYRPGVDPQREVSVAGEIPGLLGRHVNSPVYFHRALQHLLQWAADAVLIETGCGTSLSSLIRRFRPETVLSTEDPAGLTVDFDRVLRAVQA